MNALETVDVAGTADRNNERMEIWKRRYRARFGWNPSGNVSRHRELCGRDDFVRRVTRQMFDSWARRA